MKFIDNNIEFTNVQEPGIEVESAPIGMLNNYSYSNNNQNITKGNKYIVNAIDIDWNGAKIDENTTINTTGELISWISSKSSDDCPECVVSSDKFGQRTIEDLSENNILQLFVNGAENTPIFQIGGTNSKIQKSMLSDELKNQFVLEGINKIDFYRWEEVIQPVKNSVNFTVVDRVSFRIIKNGIIIKDITVDILMDNDNDTRYPTNNNIVSKLPFISKLNQYIDYNNYQNDIFVKNRSISDGYIENDKHIIGKGLFSYKIKSDIPEILLLTFYRQSITNIEEFNQIFKINDNYIFSDNDQVILTLPQFKLSYINNIPLKIFNELNSYKEILDGNFIYVARTVEKQNETSNSETYLYSQGMQSIIGALTDLFGNNYQYSLNNCFSYSDSPSEIVDSLINNNTQNINNYINNAKALTMALYELQFYLNLYKNSNGQVSILQEVQTYKDALQNQTEALATYNSGQYLVLTDPDNNKYLPENIESEIRKYYTTSDILTKTNILLDYPKNINVQWKNIINNGNN